MGQLQQATKGYQPGIVRAEVKGNLIQLFDKPHVFIHEVSFNVVVVVVVVGQPKPSANIQTPLTRSAQLMVWSGSSSLWALSAGKRRRPWGVDGAALSLQGGDARLIGTQ